jgi:hypothetical protein
MIINSSPTNEAVLSNVGEVGEFRIRNSAKAFNILSSGLYANKIRAIVRELSCNAVDSHVAAGRSDVPFDVHLPTSLEPTFSIRDYGTGLSHEQVTNIYTTYFESTKTESNDFIGALGLGSKSPFSYTDNFTVTAVKNGRKGVYTAFINEAGVPSIALMAEEATTDPAGVEIKFAVEDRYDFNKFVDEAHHVYRYFALRPVVSGPDFEFREVEYETRDLIPGVHVYNGHRTSRAIMGNIAYPIEVPNADKTLGELRHLLNCGLELHFAIGELDFQASREGLSYIPQTIEAIRNKLSAVNAQLAVHIAQEADAISNLWARTHFLIKKAGTELWKAAVSKYVIDSKFQLIDGANTHYPRARAFNHGVAMMAKQFNITVSGFRKDRGSLTCSPLKVSHNFDRRQRTVSYWEIPVSEHTYFVVTDTKVGALERAKHHWRKTPPAGAARSYAGDHVFVLSPADKSQPMKTEQFFASLRNPETSHILLASDLTEKDRKTGNSGMGANVSIMRLQRRGYGGYHKEREMVWKDAGKADSFDTNKTYYYLPLTGFVAVSQGPAINDIRKFNETVTESGIAGLHDIRIYGVRKTDQKWVEGQKNWVNVQDHIRAVLANVNGDLVRKVAVKALDLNKYFRYNSSIANLVSDKNSQYLTFQEKVKGTESLEVNRHSFERLCRDYAVEVNVDAVMQSIKDELTAVRNRYPLLSSLRDYDIDTVAVAQYINMIDKEA